MTNENSIIQIKPEEINLRVTEVENFTEKVKEGVARIVPVLPSDLKSTPDSEGDELEKKVSGFISQVELKAKDLKDQRLELTRKFDEVKKYFTSNESEVKTEIEKLSSFVNSWAGEKLRRKREKERRAQKVIAYKEYLLNLRSNITSHYLRLISDILTSYFLNSEIEYYAADATGLEKFKRSVIDGGLDMVENIVRSNLKNNMFKHDGSDEAKTIHSEVMGGPIKEFFKKECSETFEKLAGLVNFIPSRLEQLSSMNAEKAKKEQELIEEKQRQEKIEAENKMNEQLAKEAMDGKIELAMDAAAVMTGNEVLKGTSVKLKYYPENHGQLLKLLQYYILHNFNSEDFEKLNARLSFVRTFCDTSLNKDGVIIEGVPYEEEVKKRKG